MNIASVKGLDLNPNGSFFNCGAWADSSKQYIYLLGRENSALTPAPVPDISELTLCKLTNDLKLINKTIVWKPKYDSLFLEDPRVIEVNNELVIGLTAVLRNQASFYPFPAFIEIADKDNWPSKFPNINLLEDLGPGKNVTPIDDRILIYRPDDVDYYHKLAVVDYNNKENVAKHIGDIDLPKDLAWAEWKIGTTIPPIWVNDKEALFIVQGISVVDNKYVYNVGRSKLIRDGDKFKVDVLPQSFLTPEKMEEITHEKVEERFPYRRVLYVTGGIIKGNEPEVLYLYINIGDRKTFEVGYKLSDLKEGLF